MESFNDQREKISVVSEKVSIINDFLTDDKEQFESILRETALQSFQNSILNIPTQQPTQTQGLTTTALMRGEVKYTKIRKKSFLPLIRAELTVRGMAYFEK